MCYTSTLVYQNNIPLPLFDSLSFYADLDYEIDAKHALNTQGLTFRA